jgi:hypothetical protein
MRQVKSKQLKVIPVCSQCKEPVTATKKDTAYRHGFKRYKLSIAGIDDKKFSQEDGKSCPGSGQPVMYKKRKK